MKGKLLRILMGLLALVMVIAFLLPPMLKLKAPGMIVVILIGVACMVYNFIEVVREKGDT